MSNFHSLEVVGRGSETQLQVSENVNSHQLNYGAIMYSDNFIKYLRSECDLRSRLGLHSSMILQCELRSIY